MMRATVVQRYGPQGIDVQMKKCIRHTVLLRGMTFKERPAPMSKLPVIVVSTMTNVEFRARNNTVVGCFRTVQ